MEDLKLETALETIDQTHSFDLAIKWQYIHTEGYAQTEALSLLHTTM